MMFGRVVYNGTVIRVLLVTDGEVCGVSYLVRGVIVAVRSSAVLADDHYGDYVANHVNASVL